MADGHLHRLNMEALRPKMSGRVPPTPVVLLGAGASVKAGVPTAGDLVSMAGKWAWCEREGRSYEDQTVMPSDWQPWLKEQSWFDQARPLAELYPVAVERLLRPQESRRRFFRAALASDLPVSDGYKALARLLASRAILTVLTVNFDGLIAKAAHADYDVPHITTISRPADIVDFSLAPTYPQVVEVHGSFEHYQDRNLLDEVQQLDENLKNALWPLLRDHPIVVIGYRGAEASVMDDFLLGGSEQPLAFRHGLYWCVLGEQDEELHPNVVRLANRLGSNFALVDIPGFDRAMQDWASDVVPAGVPAWTSSNEPDVPDLRPSEAALEELDVRAVLERYAEYRHRLDDEQVPGDDPWSALRALRVARDVDGEPRVTRAGELLFSNDEVTRVEIRADDAFLTIAGNLFRVLAEVEEALDELNRPFRLKAAVSEEVRRFDPRAIKEIVVNALAHRDHDDERPVRVVVTARQLQVISPGTVMPTVDVEELGRPGVKAYRNPVVANVLYGAGAMDKAGSGITDVMRWARQAGGEASFGLTADGSSFVATMTARDVDLNEVTGTADAGQLEHFTVNALLVDPPPLIHLARTSYRNHGRVFDDHPGISLPPFTLHRGKAAAFVPFTGELGQIGTGVGDPIGIADDPRLGVELLNRELLQWARARDLYVHPPSVRMWFPRDAGGAREVTYRARVREATRTVTKPQLAADGQRVRHWVHEAVRASFRKYGDTWVLHLVPTIVFTTDGYGNLLRGPKVSPMATRALARDFNPQVHNDLYFWRWVLCGEEPEAAVGAMTIRASFPGWDALDAPQAIGGFGDPTDAELALGSDDDDLEIA